MIRISHLDHCSCLLFTNPLLPLSLSQSILHSAARGILLNPKTNHIPSLLTILWCPLPHSKWKSKLCPWPPPSLTSSPNTGPIAHYAPHTLASSLFLTHAKHTPAPASVQHFHPRYQYGTSIMCSKITSKEKLFLKRNTPRLLNPQSSMIPHLSFLVSFSQQH